MPTTRLIQADPPAPTTGRLPVLALVLMALTDFIVIVTETLPAGLLPQLGSDFGVSEGAAGQLVSAYALGTVIAAVPAVSVTQGVSRKRLLIAGQLWGMLAGYARRIVAPEQAGRALAIAMTGTPVAHLVAAVPGVGPVLAVVFIWMLADNLLFTYITPFLASSDLELRTDVALLVVGLSALVGIWITAVLIDRALRPLALASVAAFVVVALALTVGSVPAAVCAIAGWGIAFGGSATQLQTASANGAGEAADVANAMLTTVFNLAVFAAGAAGALVVDGVGARAIPAAMGILSVTALVIVACARRYAFPRG